MDMPMGPSPEMPSGDMPMNNKMMDMGMHMTFFWGSRVEILFSGWPGDRGVGMYVLALLVVLAASALLECLSALSRRLSRAPGTGTSMLLTAVHAVRMGMAYLVMLATMSFNGGVLIAAIAGHALGFLLFGSGILARARGRGRGGQIENSNHVHTPPSAK